MVKQFLKMAGARNEKEFLSMFPTEESFFRAYPEARQLSNPEFGVGGIMDGPGKKRKKSSAPPTEYIQYIDGQPVSVDFASSPQGNISEYLDLIGKDPSYANRAQIASRLNIPNYTGTAAQNIGMYNTLQNNNIANNWPYSFAQPVNHEYGGMYHYGPGGPILPGTLKNAVKETLAAQNGPSGGIPPMIARPADQMDNFVGPTQPAQYAQSAPAIPQYQGVSIVDMLGSKGMPSDFATRKAIAEDMGISGYKGTPTQNRQLIEMMGGKFNGASGAASPRKGKKSSGVTAEEMAAYNDAIAKDHPYIMAPNPGQSSSFNPFPGSQGSGTGNNQPVQDNNGNWIMPTLGIVGGAGIGYGAYKGTKAELNAIKGMGNLYKGKSAQEISKLIKARGFRLPGDAEQLAKAGMKPAEAMSELKGLRYIEGATKDALAAAQQGNVFQKTAKALEQARPIAQNYANRFKNAKPILDKIKAAGVRTGADIDALRAAGLTSKETMVALKGISTAKVAAAAKNVGKWGDAFKAGVAAFQEAPLIKAAWNAIKFREYGGEQMAYGGMYDDGGMYAHGGVSGQSFNPGVYEDGYSGTSSAGNYFPQGGTFIPQPMMMPGQLPEYGYGRAMYGAGMAYGGGYAQGGSYTKGSVHDMDESQIQELINQGYKIEYV